MAGWVDVVRHGEVSGWIPAPPEEIADRLVLVVNGRTTNLVAAARERNDLARGNIFGTGFIFAASLEIGDRVEVFDRVLNEAVSGGVRCAAGALARPLELKLVCVMKCEEDYLGEWIAFHKMMGFSLIIGDNSDSLDDPQARLLRELHAGGVIERVDLIGRSYAQLPFYEAMLRHFSDEHSVLGFIDCDEFLSPVGNLRSAAAIVGDYFSDWSVSAVAFNWACYGSSGLLKRAPGLVIERFTRRAPQEFAANKHVKSFVRGGRAKSFAGNPHAVALHWGNYLQSDFSKIVWSSRGRGISNEVSWNGLRVNHYTIKSAEEFEIKGRRGSAISAENTKVKQRQNYFAGYDQNQVEDRSLTHQAGKLRN